MFNFERFSGVGDKWDDRISLTKSHFIGLPHAFCEKHRVADFNYVELFFDKEKKAIAFKFLKDKSDSCYRLNYSEANRSASISARSFLRFYDIDPLKYSGKYPAVIVPDETIGPIYVIELKEHEPT
ncbi:MAG: hypothetical protein V1907_03575 [Candidatus Kerfeldbacteria bacterium]